MEFFKAFADYPWLSLLFFVLLILTVFVVIKAYKASKKTRKEREALIEKLRKENRLKHAYKDLTEEIINKAPAKDLFEGIALNLQASLEMQTDINRAYDLLKPEQKHIYAFYFLLEDSKERLSNFFAISDKPLTDDAGEAVALIMGSKAKELYSLECAAYDSENEEVSLIKEEVERIDGEFAKILKSLDVYEAAAKYIRENAAVFVRMKNLLP